MGTRLRIESSTSIYHVMQRGVGKQIIFEDYEDHSYYLKKLAECKETIRYDLLAYCLMNNHIHLLLKIEKPSLSVLMHRLGTSYAWYYNNKYDHCGHVFQGRFLSEPVQDDKYLQSCIRYIHNNPVAAGISARENYQWSSYNEYVLGEGNGQCDTDFFLSIIGGKDEFVRFSKTIDDTKVMDPDSTRPSYEDGFEIIKEVCKLKNIDGSIDGSIVGRLSKHERNNVIRILQSQGYSAREIERLTGVSKNIIYKVATVYGK